VSRVKIGQRAEGEPGQRAPSVRDIASLARVSTATVSRVLNGSSNVSAQRQRAVKEAIQHTGFRPNAAAAQLAGLSALKRRGKQGV
jgi:DNA-binding LacI/PurR family transcriptional regulator